MGIVYWSITATEWTVFSLVIPVSPISRSFFYIVAHVDIVYRKLLMHVERIQREKRRKKVHNIQTHAFTHKSLFLLQFQSKITAKKRKTILEHLTETNEVHNEHRNLN